MLVGRMSSCRASVCRRGLFCFSLLVLLLLQTVLCSNDKTLDNQIRSITRELEKGGGSRKELLSKRASLYNQQGDNFKYTADLTRILEIYPKDTNARELRAQAYVKGCRLKEGLDDFNELKKHGLYRDEIKEISDKLVKYNKAMKLYNNKEYKRALQHFADLVSLCTKSFHIHRIYAELSEKNKDYSTALKNYILAFKIHSDDQILHKAVEISSYLGLYDKAIALLKIYLKSDMDNVKYKKQLNALIKVRDKIQHFDALIDMKKWTRIVELTDNDTEIQDIINEYNLKITKFQMQSYYCMAIGHLGKCENIKVCKTAIDLLSDNQTIIRTYLPEFEFGQIYYSSANCHLLLSEYDEALRNINHALEYSPGNRSYHQLISEINVQKKKNPDNDYYKILGVNRMATSKDIRDAYYKLARKWHPDRLPDGPEKEKAVDKMSKINHAKEILLDDSKRRKYDMGELENEDGYANQGDPRMYYGGGGTKRRIIITGSPGRGNGFFSEYFAYSDYGSGGQRNPFGGFFSGFDL